MRDLMLKSVTTLVLYLAVATNPAWASNLSSFNAAVAAAYDHYRAAAFYLRTGNPAVAGFELAEAAQRWSDAVMPFAKTPPDAFADDPAFAADLADIMARLGKADALLASGGDAESAADMLDPIRDRLAELRRRNGVIVFSDHVDAANAAMDRLWVYRHEPPDWADPAARAALTGATAVTIHLYDRLRELAPPETAENAEFQRIMKGALASLAGLWEQIQLADEERVISYLRELRSFDRILWLQFG